MIISQKLKNLSLFLITFFVASSFAQAQLPYNPPEKKSRQARGRQGPNSEICRQRPAEACAGKAKDKKAFQQCRNEFREKLMEQCESRGRRNLERLNRACEDDKESCGDKTGKELVTCLASSKQKLSMQCQKAVDRAQMREARMKEGRKKDKRDKKDKKDKKEKNKK